MQVIRLFGTIGPAVRFRSGLLKKPGLGSAAVVTRSSGGSVGWTIDRREEEVETWYSVFFLTPPMNSLLATANV